MMSFVRYSVLTVLCVALFGPIAHAQNIEAEVEGLKNDVAKARSDNLHLSSPNAFEEAAEYLADAQEKMKKGEKMSDIGQAVKRGQRRLADGRQFTDIGGVILKDAFAARNNALDARAPEFATGEWEDGEQALQSAGSEVEDGDQNDARDDAKEATSYYRKAELKAIQSNLLGVAREHRAAARKAEAEEWAPQTWKDADAKLKKADQILKEDRYNLEETRTLAEEATAQFKHAKLLAETARRIDDDVEKNAEKVILEYEDRTARIGKTLGTSVHFGNGQEAVTERLVAAAQSMNDNRRNLQSTLQERDEQIDRLRQVVDSLDSRLADLEQRERTMSTQLQAKRDRDQTLKRMREVFSPQEASVLSSGDGLVIRMQGLNFPSGSSEIQPQNFGLLTKLQQVIREFSDGRVTISGHTDSRGNDAMNMKLSEERSEAVRQYLAANMDLDEGRLQAVGRGESEPIASNETDEGRLKNRRIDVMIDFK